MKVFRTTVYGAVLLVTLAGSADADPPAHPAPTTTTCNVALPTVTIAVSWGDAMTGTVAVDGPNAKRRFRVKATPYAATYILLFQAYGPSDEKPSSETLSAGKSIVARVVLNGDAMRLYLDGDYTPPGLRPAADGYACK